MNLVHVTSSMMTSIGYDAQTQQLTILFASGKRYTFCRVPSSLHAGLMNACSKGRFYNDHIKDRYHC